MALAQSAQVSVDGGAAVFAWAVARLSGCPFALSVGPVTARPCAGVDVGVLQGSGSGVARPLEEARTWLAATAGGRLRWRLFDGLFAEADGGLTLPFFRDSFVFRRPSRAIYEVPALGGFATAGLGVVLE